MYFEQLGQLVIVACLLALAAYVPLAGGFLVVCQGAFMGVGAVSAAAVYARTSLPFGACLLLGSVAAALYATCVAFLCARLKGFGFAVATLGLGQLSQVVVLNSRQLGGALGYTTNKYLPSAFYPVAVLGIVVLLLFHFERSGLRMALQATRDNNLAATAVGIDLFKLKLIAVAASGFLAGLAGGIYIHLVGIFEPHMFGFGSSVQILMYAIVGGSGNFLGPMVGALLLTVIPELFRFSSALRMLLYGTSLVAVVVLRPDGIVGARRRFRLELAIDPTAHAPSRG